MLQQFEDDRNLAMKLEHEEKELKVQRLLMEANDKEHKLQQMKK